MMSNTCETYIRIANPNWIFGGTHLRPKLALAVEMELLHNAIISRLQHLDLRTTQMVARCEMGSSSTAECQRLDARRGRSGNDMCGEILDSSRLDAG
jgi:hypothetical protein